METLSRFRSRSGALDRALLSTLLLGLAALLAPSALAAQAADAPADRPAVLEGTIVSAGSAAGDRAEAAEGAPIPGAEVWILGTAVGTLTDEEGRFRLTGLPPGRYRLLVGARDHQEAVTSVEVAAGETGTVRVSLEGHDAELERRADALVVERSVGRRSRAAFQGFRDRMQSGMGQYVTQEEIDAAETGTLSEVIRRYTNADVQPCSKGGGGAGGSCYWVVTGTEMRLGGVGGVSASAPGDPGGLVGSLRAGGQSGGSAGKACVADVFLDGTPMNQEMLPNGIDAVLASQLAGVEIYRRGALAPPQFRTVGGCGVVLLWTRRAGGGGSG